MQIACTYSSRGVAAAPSEVRQKRRRVSSDKPRQEMRRHGRFEALTRGPGACRTWGVEAKFGPSEDSFCRICRPIALAMGQKAGEKWTAAVKLQPTFPKSDRLLGENVSRGAVGAFGCEGVDAGHHGRKDRGAENRRWHSQHRAQDRTERAARRAGTALVLGGVA